MRIVNLETFLKMPVGTVYSRYKEEFDESFELCIKGESDVEFEFSKHQRLLEPVNLPISPSDQYSFENNLNKEIEIGYDRDSLFIVFEQRDTENLIERLKATLPKQEIKIDIDVVPKTVLSQLAETYKQDPDDSSHDKNAIEELAKKIYNAWNNQEGWVPWVPNGNSLKQDEARKLAIHELNARRAEEY